VLPEEYAQDADRMARFAREAQVLAGLNPPATGDGGGNQRWYFANTKSAACPQGYGQEETIKLIWAEDVRK
jgi:hypothetical protein